MPSTAAGPRSISELKADAPAHLAAYCNPASAYAWPAYDTDFDPNRLTAAEVLAPAFLSYPIQRSYVERMFQVLPDGAPVNEYGRLLDALCAVIADEVAAKRSFEDIDHSALTDCSEPGWGLVLRAMQAVQHCKGLTSVAVTKILHRKRPRLVPINDTRLRAFYDVGRGGYPTLFESIHGDMARNLSLLDEWREPYTVYGRPMSRLRCLDIVVWMHIGG